MIFTDEIRDEITDEFFSENIFLTFGKKNISMQCKHPFHIGKDDQEDTYSL